MKRGPIHRGTPARIRKRIQSFRPAVNDEALLRELTARMAELRAAAAPERLQWIRAQAGQTVLLIHADDVDHLR